MSPILVQFLRRLAIGALLVTVGLLALPRVLTDLGLLGPAADELIGNAESALAAARSYGARDDLPSFVAARKELDEARALLQARRPREARQAALRASEKAIQAQRDGLIQRDEDRRHAAAIVTEIDRRLNELERLYGRASKTVDSNRRAELLTLMKAARQAGSGLVLVYERDDFDRVIAGEKDALAALDAVRETMARVLER
jgi:hypothetical protein